MKAAAYFICVSSIACLGLFYFAADRADKTLILVVCSILGFFLIPILFVAYEIAVEQTASHGIGDAMSCGLLNVFANTVAFIITISLTPSLNEATPNELWIAFGVMFLNLGLALLFLLLGSFCASKTSP